MRRQRYKQADRDIRSALRYRAGRTAGFGLDVRWPFVLLALTFMLVLYSAGRGGL